MHHDNEMFQTLPWPFKDNVFPTSLGAVVQRTVIEGRLPALVVGHSVDGDWYIGDGVNDPNVRDACVAEHIVHVVEADPSVGVLATMPPGHEAFRPTVHEMWVIEPKTLE